MSASVEQRLKRLEKTPAEGAEERSHMQHYPEDSCRCLTRSDLHEIRIAAIADVARTGKRQANGRLARGSRLMLAALAAMSDAELQELLSSDEPAG